MIAADLLILPVRPVAGIFYVLSCVCASGCRCGKTLKARNWPD